MNNNTTMSFLNKPDFIDKPKMDKENNLRMANGHIRYVVRQLYKTHRLLNTKFYFIHINHYCFIENKGFVPCEIAMTEFCIKDGVTRTWHKFVNPGEIPVGYSSLIMDHREQTHKLSWPLPSEVKTIKLQEVYTELVSFIQGEECQNVWGSNVPPLFTVNYNEKFVNPADNERIVSDVLNSLCTKNGAKAKFMVYPAVKLYHELRDSCALFAGIDTHEHFSVSEKEMEKDVFQHRRNLACEYHISLDAVEYCSKSFVLRWSYTILGDCCDIVHVTKVSNKHMPPAIQAVVHEQITDVYFGRWLPERCNVIYKEPQNSKSYINTGKPENSNTCANCKRPLTSKDYAFVKELQSTEIYRSYKEPQNNNTSHTEPENNKAYASYKSSENIKACSDSKEAEYRKMSRESERNENEEAQSYSEESLALAEYKPSTVRKPNPETLKEAIRTCRSTMSLLIKSNAVEPEYFVSYDNKAYVPKMHH